MQNSKLKNASLTEQNGSLGSGLRLGVVGADTNNINLGVAALGHGIIRALDHFEQVEEITMFDYGRSVSPFNFVTATRSRLQRCGIYKTRRYFRPESLRRIRFERALGVQWSDASKVLNTLDAILDVTGGDSFTDLYGIRRFKHVTAPKELAIKLGIPLVLLPQTYGPFQHDWCLKKSQEVSQKALFAMARDKPSYERMKSLLEDSYDPSIHLLGVDMSFAMSPEDPSAEVLEKFAEIKSSAGGAPLVGLNVSGLIYRLEDGGAAQYGFKTNYRELVEELIAQLVRKHGAHIVLVPHVLGFDHREADPSANLDLMSKLSKDIADHTHVIMTDRDPAKAKSLISRFDWFCGTRMHSTIASLSTETPTGSIVYSDKAVGVFETCGMQNHAIDPRKLDKDQVIEKVIESFVMRDAIRNELKGLTLRMKQLSIMQIAKIVEHLDSSKSIASTKFAASSASL